MNKKNKALRILSILLSLVMLLGVVPITAIAEETPHYTLTVENGWTENSVYSYSAGERVYVKGLYPRGEGIYVFVKWTSDDGVVFKDETSFDTWFTMPAKNVTVTAIFEEREEKTFSESFDGLSTTSLPASFDYELGSENILYYDEVSYNYCYAKLIKFEANANSTLLFSFAGKDSVVDTKVSLFDSEKEVYNWCESDNFNGEGEQGAFYIENAGTYYLALTGYMRVDTGLCHAELSMVEGTVQFEDAKSSLTETTALPAAFDYELGSGDIYADDYYYSIFYGKLVKITVDKRSLLTASFASKDESKSVDTVIRLFNEAGECLCWSNFDNLNGEGEKIIGAVEPGTYYLSLEGNYPCDVGMCHAEISLTTPDGVVLGSLDFTADPVPTPAEGDLWSWDADSNTLTLKDGFAIAGTFAEYEEETSTITLPADSTVIVEGTATILYSADNGIERSYSDEEGSLTIRGNGADKSKLVMLYTEYTGIYAGGKNELSISDIYLDLTAGSYGAYAKNITAKNITAVIDSWYQCFDSNNDIIIENSKLTLESGWSEGLWADNNITLKNCDTSITTDNDYCIYSDTTGCAVTVSGGKLYVHAADFQAIRADYLAFENGAAFNLNSADEYAKPIYIRTAGIELPGSFIMYDCDGEIIYSGEWNDNLLFKYDDNKYIVLSNNAYPSRIASAVSLTVDNGEGGGTYAWGDKAVIKANAPADGFVFDKWVGSDGVTFADASAPETTMVIPAGNATVTATYKAAPVDPIEPDDPVDPGKPDDPADPGAPEDPVEPDDDDGCDLWICRVFRCILTFFKNVFTSIISFFGSIFEC